MIRTLRFDKYRALESARRADSQQLLIPETFDLTPAQAAVFDAVAAELESYGFELMRLSGRTVAIKAAPADLPAGEARNMLAELLDQSLENLLVRFNFAVEILKKWSRRLLLVSLDQTLQQLQRDY